MDTQAQIQDLYAKIASISTSKDISRDTETSLKERLGLNNLQAWPVSSIFISIVATNPNTLLGYGTWSLYSQGQVLVGYKSGDADFGTLGATGGEKTHTLSIGEIPSHSHPGAYGAGVWNTNGANSSTLAQPTSPVPSITPGIVSQGGDGAHNNLQPYIVVYIWNRTG